MNRDKCYGCSTGCCQRSRLLRCSARDVARHLQESVRAGNIYCGCTRRTAIEFVHSVTGVRTLKDEMEKVAAHNTYVISMN